MYRQGDQARYFTQRKNLYDLRRTAAIGNLEKIQRVNQQQHGQMAAQNWAKRIKLFGALVQKVARYKSVTNTQIYTHPTDEDV